MLGGDENEEDPAARDATRMELVALLATPPGSVIPETERLLGQVTSIRGETEAELLRELAAEGPPRVQLNAARLLSRLDDPAAADAITALAESSDELTRLVAKDCSHRDRPTEVFADLARACTSERIDVRHYAISALGHLDERPGCDDRLRDAVIDELANLTAHEDVATRALVIRQILSLRPAALEDLELGVPLTSSNPIEIAQKTRAPSIEHQDEDALDELARNLKKDDPPKPPVVDDPIEPKLIVEKTTPTIAEPKVATVEPAQPKEPTRTKPPPAKSRNTPPKATPKATAKKRPAVPKPIQVAKQRGPALLHQGKAAEVIPLVEKAMDTSVEDDAKLFHLRGLAHLALSDNDKALDDLKRTIDLAPDLVIAYYDLARCYGARGDKRNAYSALVMALRFGYREILTIRVEAKLDLIKDSPAFHALMEHYFHSPLAADSDDARRLKLATKRLKTEFRKHRDPFLRARAVVQFPEAGRLEATQLLYDFIDDRDPLVRRTIAEVLGKSRDAPSVEFLAAAAADSRSKPERSREALLWALKAISGSAISGSVVTDAILSGLTDESLEVRLAAVDAIGTHPDRRAVDVLIALLDEVQGIDRLTVIESLGKITGKDLGLASVDWRNWWKSHGAKVEIGPVRDPCAGPPKSTIAIPSAYSDRSGKAKKTALARFGGSRETEQAVEAALEWLARHQNKDGRWDTDQWALRCTERDAWNRVTKVRQRVWDVQVSGLALLAFLGAGYTHVEGKYHDTVSRGLSFLQKRQRADGYFAGDHHHWRRSHEIATIALTEAYLMTRDCRLRDSAVRGVRWILARQHLNGGWGWHRQESYTSLTGWNLTALSTALDAGLDVPASSIVATRSYLDTVTLETANGKLAAGFAYETLRPAAQVGESLSVEKHDDVRAGGGALSTTVGLWCRTTLGQSAKDPRVLGALSQMRRAPPRANPEGKVALDDRLYFGTQAALLHGGSVWKDWNRSMKTALLPAAVEKGCERGSWIPTSDHGRVHATALAALMLESYYRFRPAARK